MIPALLEQIAFGFCPAQCPLAADVKSIHRSTSPQIHNTESWNLLWMFLFFHFWAVCYHSLKGELLKAHFFWDPSQARPNDADPPMMIVDRDSGNLINPFVRVTN